MINLLSNYKKTGFFISLFLSDCVAYLISVFFAYETRILFQNVFDIIPLQFLMEYFVFGFWWIFALYFIFFASFGLYSRRFPFWQESREVFRASSATFLFLFAFISLGKMSEDISRLTVVFLWFYSFIIILLFRHVIKTFLYKHKLFLENTVVVGDYRNAQAVADSFKREPFLGQNIIGIVTPDTKKYSIRTKYKVLGNVDEIEHIVKQYKITSAILLPGMKYKYDMSLLVGKLQIMLSQIIVMPALGRVAFSNAQTMQTLTTRLSYFQINNNIKSLVNRVMKRTLDLTLAILALPFFLLVTLLIAVLIKSGSKGAVFYSQKRVGRRGKTIKILKFRSMYHDADKRLKDILTNDAEARAEWEKSFKLKNDPRITPIGKFLRQTSLDELPQVFNVLKGDMSLIGPRPVLQVELDKYYKNFASYYMMVRPGITGLWQISGRSNTGYDFRVGMDAWYVLNWSVWLDLVILLKTPAAVFKKEGAY